MNCKRHASAAVILDYPHLYEVCCSCASIIGTKRLDRQNLRICPYCHGYRFETEPSIVVDAVHSALREQNVPEICQ